jgi:hypothetical protein
MTETMDPQEMEPLEAIVVDDDEPSALAVIAVWLGVALVAVIVVWFAWTQVINPSGGTVVEEYVSGDAGYMYESLRDQFKAEFPERPEREALSGEFGETAVVTSRPGSGYTFTVIREPKPESSLENYSRSLNSAARAIQSEFGGELVEQTPPLPLTIQSVAVKFITLRKGNQYQRTQLTLATDRLYTVQVTMNGDDEDPFKRLAETFQVLGPR